VLGSSQPVNARVRNQDISPGEAKFFEQQECLFPWMPLGNIEDEKKADAKQPA
jgi:hypothetical protein